MSEAVRLVIWDLDETFWNGTLTEGGIDYVQANHDIVVELAGRGILNSICSKNDAEPVKAILEERGLWPYFIFPSIDWEPKGARIAAIIEAVRLRPESVLFIDDNALNRNEALDVVPGLQVGDESIISAILNHPRFRGKEDRSLSRLQQYKLLEDRRAEQEAHVDITEFLRRSDIAVTIEHEVENHIDRAVELINRTNQLNFTKKRLSEDPEKARAELRREMSHHTRHVGLVQVRDRYGDYGFVGFYLVQAIGKSKTLVHFCFSCRILGMKVENWIYEALGRPELHIVGDVKSDVLQCQGGIDWINQKPKHNTTRTSRVAGRIFIRGGCAMTATAHYIGLSCDKFVGEFDSVRDGRGIRIDHSRMLRNALEGMSDAQLQEAEKLGYRREDFVSALRNTHFDACILSFLVEHQFALYRHPTTGLTVPFFHVFQAMMFKDIRLLEGDRDDRTKAAIERLRAEKYEFLPADPADFIDNVTVILEKIPTDTTLVFLLGPETRRPIDGVTKPLPAHLSQNQAMRAIAARRPRTFVLSISDFVVSPDDRVDDYHFGRMVYQRITQALLNLLEGGEDRTQPRDREPTEQNVSALCTSDLETDHPATFRA
jgi:FkbH-like protein